jgi:formylglycine-generating enzyme required for sulfatase activity
MDVEAPVTPEIPLRVARQPRRAQCFTEPAFPLDLMLISGGTFLMGSPEDELGRWDDESPQHEVAVSPFLMGRYPVTQSQWRLIADQEELQVKQALEEVNPSEFEGENHPVENVSWLNAVEFCERLSRLTGRV